MDIYNKERYGKSICFQHANMVLSEKGCTSCTEYFPRSMGRIIRLSRVHILGVEAKRKIAKVCSICFDQLKVLTDCLLLMKWPKNLIELVIIMFIKSKSK